AVVERLGIRGKDSAWKAAAGGTAGHSEQHHLSRIGQGRSQLHGDVQALLPVGRDGVWAGFPADHRALLRGYAAGSAPALLPLIAAKAISTSGAACRTRSTLATIFVANAHRDDGKRFVVRADEKLAAFAELESATRGSPSFTHPCTVKRHS